MYLRNLIFIITLAFSTILQLHSMEQKYTFNQYDMHDPMSFEIHTDKLHVRLRQVTLGYLTMQDSDDHLMIVEHVGDFDAIQSMLGTPPACALAALHLVSPESVLALYLKYFASKYEKMPDNQKTLFFWFIEDISTPDQPQFMGKATVTTYIDEVPTKYADTYLLEFGLTLSKQYRNKGITSQLAAAVYQHLATLEPFQDGTFCFDTRTDNIAMHKIATKIGAQLIASRDKVIDFGIIDNPDFPAYTVSSDLFIIPRQ